MSAFNLLKLISDIATRPPARDAVLLVDRAWTTHYSESPGLVLAARQIVEAHTGTLSWSKKTGLKLPDRLTSDPATLAEVWVWRRGLKIHTFQSVRYKNSSHKIKTLCFAWIRRSSQWRGATYNAMPQPHGDEPVRVYEYERVLKLIAMLQSDRNGA